MPAWPLPWEGRVCESIGEERREADDVFHSGDTYLYKCAQTMFGCAWQLKACRYNVLLSVRATLYPVPPAMGWYHTANYSPTSTTRGAWVGYLMWTKDSLVARWGSLEQRGGPACHDSGCLARVLRIAGAVLPITRQTLDYNGLVRDT